ncbi:preprotein translocase subunit SecG [Biformimicrobium ophioploci]|uniref:Protein-export membrane protein SecG n=1 Tax=Biformimicrobium ophioploci TaxID=3036711 RepID=A0ABQ6LWF6_9GAMM|nr:preprotein translocase subunit SecG [Microbulbifer sp. NKW57]GMG86390.1 preprotein translocase subunit SecG [Microbulbifer sp. NKW57]
MEKIILVFHVLTAISIIGLILLQQGKGAEAGASFGAGASQTVFGSQGGGNFFSRLTAILATVFFVTSFALAIVAKNNAGGSDDLGIPEIPAAEQTQPEVPAFEGEGDVPVVEDAIEAEVPEADEAEQPQ